MKILTVLILAGLGYAFGRLAFVLVKELAEFAAEAWHQGDA